ncbi:hypothetical protein D3C79_1115760 [compost metagenome]
MNGNTSSDGNCCNSIQECGVPVFSQWTIIALFTQVGGVIFFAKKLVSSIINKKGCLWYEDCVAYFV